MANCEAGRSWHVHNFCNLPVGVAFLSKLEDETYLMVCIFSARCVFANGIAINPNPNIGCFTFKNWTPALPL